MIEKVQKLIEQIIPFCISWLKDGDDGMLRFVDPNEEEEISAHYGATHAAASFIIWGKHTCNDELYHKGLTLLHSILKRWGDNKRLHDFHFDFNNFAISIVEPLVDTYTASLIRETVCNTKDSNHLTINWIPMRWAVNRKRLEWTKLNKYEAAIAKCRKNINDATNSDGGIEDRLPHGKSFNLQYDIATVAVLQYLRICGEEINLSKELGFLLNAISPDGDINYQGRGTNQIFAWGLWIYLLSSSNQKQELTVALNYLDQRLGTMLEHTNIMLNNWDGKEKYLWWDYHFTSVYVAHCLLWLVLAYIDKEKAPILSIPPLSTATGLHIIHSKTSYVSWFEGRSEYLAERGPTINALWTKNQGMICKGAFAPWQGDFGNKYIYENIVLKNFCGLLEVKRNIDWSKKYYLHKLIPKLKSEVSCSFRPIFCPIYITENNNLIEITWNVNRKSELIFNLPSILNFCSVKLFADGKEKHIFCNSAIKNQYGWVYIYQSKAIKAKQIKLLIK